MLEPFIFFLETDNAMEETLKRKLENPLFLYKKWTPGIEILSKPDSEILVGERMRLQAAMILGHMQWQIDEISEWQQSLIDSTIQRLKEKHNDDQDLLEGKIEKFTNLIQLKFDVQNKNMEDIRKQLLSKATKKYAKKKKNGPNWFITDENDAFLEEKFDEPWVSLMKPKMPLPKQKSRQSVLAGQSSVTKEAPSAKKGKINERSFVKVVYNLFFSEKHSKDFSIFFDPVYSRMKNSTQLSP